MPPARPPIPDTLGERIRVKRIYRAARVSDGKRILVDRLWPRGVAKDRARLFDWCKDIAPSDTLRHWFHANPDQWQDFVTRYRAQPRPDSSSICSVAPMVCKLVYLFSDHFQESEDCYHR